MSDAKKISVIYLGLLVLTLIFAIPCSYTYKPLNLSFFVSGNGQANITFTATSSAKEQQTQTADLRLSPTPLLITKRFRLPDLQSMQITINNYSGNILLSDTHINGKHFTIKNIEGEHVNILNQTALDTLFSTSQNTTVWICQSCSIANIVEYFDPSVFLQILLIYLTVSILSLIIYFKRNKIKQKLTSLYSFKAYTLMFPYFKPYWVRALLAVLITIPVGSMDAVIAWSLKPFMDVVLVEKQTGWTMYIPLMIIVFSLLQALFTYIATYMNTWVGNKVALTIKYELFCKLQRSDAAFFDKESSGNVLFRYNNDADNACSGLLNNLRVFSTRLFSSVSLIAVLLYNSWQLAIVAIIVMFCALLPLSTMRKRLSTIVTADAGAIASLLNRYNEVFNGNRIIAAYNLFGYCRKKFASSINNLFSLQMQAITKTGIIAPLMHVISSFGIAFVIWYGSYLIVNHRITAGNFASFITSLVMLYNPLKNIASNYHNVVVSLMSVMRVFEKLNDTPKIRNKPQAEKLTDCQGNISYKNVCFSYIKDKPVLKNIFLDIKHGQTIALVGNSGGGKTTIASLLPRFYDVSSGSITIDDKNIKDIDLDSLRQNIAIVFQDNFLFSGTIRDNIIFGNREISEERLNAAIKGACLDEFLATLENGLDTQIGERGVTLSGGQKQRIAIARAFIKDAPILILDEATSALDNKSEAVVQKAIDNLMKNRTVIVIAHRLSTVRNADCIVVINNGKIVEQGEHEDLLKFNGEYAALYKTQLV